MGTNSDEKLTPEKEELLETRQLLYQSLLPLWNSLFLIILIH